jgi:hypothetical protein
MRVAIRITRRVHAPATEASARTMEAECSELMMPSGGGGAVTRALHLSAMLGHSSGIAERNDGHLCSHPLPASDTDLEVHADRPSCASTAGLVQIKDLHHNVLASRKPGNVEG